ncbi:unnamed protein product [Toxocara canis]|uniref:Uncharacterized protein n=1 Tax=Toxocara canis TaxID=6265 RepID=A0A183VGA0_TOXCA|nr:unnamed protein product [Toxocara canis]
MIDDGGCATILLEFEAHSAVAYFTQPLMGSVTLLDVDNVLFLTSNLRTYFDECSAFVTVQVIVERVGEISEVAKARSYELL